MFALLGQFSARAMFQSPLVQVLATSKLCTTESVPRSEAVVMSIKEQSSWGLLAGSLPALVPVAKARVESHAAGGRGQFWWGSCQLPQLGSPSVPMVGLVWCVDMYGVGERPPIFVHLV